MNTIITPEFILGFVTLIREFHTLELEKYNMDLPFCIYHRLGKVKINSVSLGEHRVRDETVGFF